MINNVDPEQRGRLQVEVPDVFSLVPSTWAEPCVPLAGPTGPPMGVYLVPPIGAGVWVEFEHGDPNYPIWVGCRWGRRPDVPSLAQAGLPADPNIVHPDRCCRTSIVISDCRPVRPGGIMLQQRRGDGDRGQRQRHLRSRPRWRSPRRSINLVGST